MKERSFIIEIGSYLKEKHGKEVCGDTFLSRKVQDEDRYVAVLSDGLGSGVRANVLSSLTASMTLNFRLMHEPIVDSARWVMDTLPLDPDRNISYSTFTVVDVDFDGETTVIEYGNPAFFIERGGEIISPERMSLEVMQQNQVKNIEVSNFSLLENDRLIVVSDGITQSGIGNDLMPFGWGIENLVSFIKSQKSKHENISAGEMAKSIVRKAEFNDSFVLKDDASCAVIYRRKPVKLMICSGPPFNESKDSVVAELVSDYKGKKIICGGTTAKIISRELKKEIIVPPLDQMDSDLPPASSMEGVDLVTEGIITLSRVSEMLETMSNGETSGANAASKIVRMLLEADIVEFIVGTCVNIAHQDPSLPMELDIRRNVIKRIAGTLEDKFLKQVSIKYL